MPLRIPADVKLEPRFEADLLEGVTVLKGMFASKRRADWQGQLYRKFQQTEGIPLRTSLLPYYAWSNRGSPEMTVWLPVD